MLPSSSLGLFSVNAPSTTLILHFSPNFPCTLAICLQRGPSVYIQQLSLSPISSLLSTPAMMWKKQLHHWARISTVVSSQHFTSSISVPTLRNSSLFSSRSLYSPSLSSLSLSKLEQKPSPSSWRLFFPNLISFLTRENAILIPKYVSFICSLSNAAEKLRCWNCGVEADDATSFLFCHACRSVQPVNDSIDYFQVFGLGRKYSIEVEELEKKYKDWQKKLHPDLVHSKTQRERKYAAEQSARVIDAYHTLADPLSRAIYIVKLEGVPVDEEERINDPELLAEIMELRETVDEAEDAQALNQIQAQLQDKLRNWCNSFEDAYMRKNFEDAQASIRRMTYYRRANEEIVKKL